MKIKFTLFCCLGFLLSGITTATAQMDPVLVANEYIYLHLEDWKLTPGDVADMTISDMYTDKSSGITRIYFLQQHQGIPVYNAILNLNITKEGKIFFAASRFVPHLQDKINAMEPAIAPALAVTSLVSHLGLPQHEVRMKPGGKEKQFVFENEDLAREDITAELSYQPHQGKVILAWDILFAPQHSHDLWNARVDAISGTVLHKNNWTLSCHIDERTYGREKEECKDEVPITGTGFQPVCASAAITNDPGTGAKYNVWPAPIESPVDGLRTIVTNPQEAIASPFGWHDIDGQPGPEYTITAGNNVHAYQDRDDLGYSSDDEPDGGPDLHFDFPFDPTWEPEQYTDAAVVNLFYWLNFMHDFSYRFGFDEAAGNFQKNNYGRGGMGDDFIWAVAQGGANTDSLHNNAKYVHKNEGTTPSIFCFDFIGSIKHVKVEEPAAVAGIYHSFLPSAGWGDGAYISDIPLTAEAVVVNDGVEEPSTADACQEIINAAELNGKIALIERGNCQFSFKALQAQNAGAVGVVFLNFDNSQLTLAAGPDAINVHIPVVLITMHDARLIREFAGQGLQITLVNPVSNPPARLDSDLQNTIIAHEFAHGISVRLAGGPEKACLDNAEQMGEGWSDFFALVTTVKPGDTGGKIRGMNTYVSRESNLGNGIRNHPYCTDMSISPLTYADINSNQEVHDRGEVWANMLWDMYWALVGRYGWSADLYDETSGNYMAIKLVMDGLKNMACDPGFADARDAILAADEVLYGGENACLLWEVFARRGLGYSADQGSPYDAGDQVEAFDLPPVCTGKIIIEKTVTDFIQAGEDIHVTIKVSNYKPETVTNVVVTDIIPDGTAFKPNSSNYNAIKQGDKLLFDLGNMNFGREKIITYTLHSSAEAWSQRKFLDEIPGAANENWLPHTLGFAASNPWTVSDTIQAHSGNYVWHSFEAPEKSQQTLMLNPDQYTFHVEGELPAFRFYHRYETLAGINGGIIEIKETGASSWTQIGDEIIRNRYKGTVAYRTFILPNVKAFSGSSGNDYKATYVDLRSWSGKDIQVRFRFGTFTNTNGGAGWIIDDLEFMDLLAYQEEVCVATDQGDYECATAPEYGTMVDTREETVSTSESPHTLSTRVYPNPATDMVTIAISSVHNRDAMITLTTLDGKQVFASDVHLSGVDYLHIHTSTFPSGIYFMKVSTGESQYVEKVVIQKM